MLNRLYALNVNESFLSNHSWEIERLESIDNLDRIDTKRNSVLMISIDHSDQVNHMIKKKLVKRLNIPCLFMLCQKSQDSISKLFEDGFHYVFTKDQSPWILKAHIENIFTNYSLQRLYSTKKILHSINLDALTKKERQIIEILCQSPRFCCHKKDLYEHIWGNSNLNTNTLEVHLCNLKRKLKGENYQLRTTLNGTVILEI